MQKSIGFKIKGMQRDLSVSTFNPEYSYENKNIRIMPTDESTLYSIINEKGNIKSDIVGIEELSGIPIGQALINNELIIFTTDVSGEVKDIEVEDSDIEDINFGTINGTIKDIVYMPEDKIYNIWFNDGKLKGKLIYSGQLNFNYKYPIESISLYENEDVKKVYWVDGLNGLRFININRDSSNYDDNSFDIIQPLSLNESIEVFKNNDSVGIFSPGTIQYAFSYYNKYGVETGIFYTTDLNYISYSDRGANPEDKVSCSFRIEIKNYDKRFDFIRVYSIHRTSIDATPEIKVVKDIELNKEDSINIINIIDNGTTGYTIDSSAVLYKGADNIIPYTISHKDNTLFLGNIKLNDIVLTEQQEEDIRNNCVIQFAYKKLEYNLNSNYYIYNNQLNNSSYKFKGFKGGEIYRIAVQLQFRNGKYSQPIFIKDIKNELYPKIENNYIFIPNLECTLSNINIPECIKYRVLMAVPQSTDKSIICQGVLSPTLFNMGDRVNNSPFSISSWFMRYYSNKGYDEALEWRHLRPLPDNSRKNAELQNTVNPELPYIKSTEEITSFVVEFYFYQIQGTLDHGYCFIVKKNGNEIAFEESYEYESGVEKAKKYLEESLIPSEEVWMRSTSESPHKVDITDNVSSESIKNKFISDEANNFYVDQSILTFHSPDIEDNFNIINNSNLKLRIIGIVEISSNMSDYSIQTSTALRNTKSIGLLNYNRDEPNLSTTAYGLINAPLWNDYAKSKDSEYNTIFAVYPWHRNGSLGDSLNSDDTVYSKLKRKIFSNLRYAYNTKYFQPSNFWEAYVDGDKNNTGITRVSVFNSNEMTNIQIPQPDNSSLGNLNYYGNVDTISSPISSKNTEGYDIQTVGRIYNDDIYSHIDSSYTPVADVKGLDPISIKYKSTPHAVFALNYTKDKSPVILPALNNRYLFSSYDDKYMDNYLPWEDTPSSFEILTLTYWTKTLTPSPSNPKVGDLWYCDELGYIQKCTSTDGGKVSWSSLNPKYGTKYKYQGKYYILIEPYSPDDERIAVLEEIGIGIHQDVLSENTSYPYLYLAELYRDIDETTIYGGTSKKAKEDNQWIPISKSEYIDTKIDYTEGDSYFQRWDCLKTYSYSGEDTNSIIDITSFMCESRINLDGRYDRNRGQKNNLAMSPSNFNLYNPVYSQSNNYFNYRILDDKFKLSDFPNTIIWSKTKSMSEDIDTWTNISMASSLDLDGDKGKLRALRRLNNNIIAFQDKGISHILYNENMQIASTEGVPIEIANSGKVNGKRYITDKIGCTNKWSICETSNGLYFIDDITKGIFLFNGKLDNLSDRLGFHSWINSRSNAINIWNPKDFNGFVTYYDKVNGDIFFISKDECLAFSEPLGHFSSFYSYEGMPYFINLEDRGISLGLDKENFDNKYNIWLHNEGDYNMFFNKYNPFYVTVIANPEVNKDKIFNNIEFRADSWNNNVLSNTTFDTLKVWNEYQEGTSKLNNVLGRPSSLKRKFRIWRANIPRDKSNNRDRIRNPWIYLKLSMENENKNKTLLHDLFVYYVD